MECGIRLRVLAKSETCPRCRRNVGTMYFLSYPGSWDHLKIPVELYDHPHSAKYNIGIESEYAAQCYDAYTAHVCNICEKKGNKRVFPTFLALNQHVYQVHNYEFCDICLENLQILSRNRRTYTHLGLQIHIKEGDSDDTSQRGE
ncbi:hypothetical protein AB6A40_004363 [Gnathostoma spinigerum]|uniref:Uncharacterized protein n=1 Tax=Gnathostoma spinigerum TaxID=75299 RepID=A0ABD6EC90_9BILA